MTRHFIAAIAGCVFVAGSTWMVHSEGQAYRAALAKARVASTGQEINEASPTLPESKGVEATPVRHAGVVAQVPSPPEEPPSSKRAVTSASKKHHGEKKEAEHSAPPPSPTVVAAATTSISQTPTKSEVAAARTKSVRGRPLANDSFWSQPNLARTWDIANLSVEDERRLGAELHELIVQFNPLLEEGPWVSRAEAAAEALQKNVERKEITYRFFILNSDVVNAFSTPGGYVYISRGLFDLIGEDEDYALQFAIGHEMAHVDRQHAIACLRDPGVMKMAEGTLQKLFMLILPFGYLERESDKYDQEFEADEWTANKMRRIGRTRREILVLLQKLEGYAQNNGFENGRVKPKPGQGLSPLENHYRAQTAARKRLKHLKEYIDQASQQAK